MPGTCSHSYTQPGDYNLTLQVSDGEESSTATAALTVQGDPVAVVGVSSSLLSLSSAEAELLETVMSGLVAGADFSRVAWEDLSGEVMGLDMLSAGLQNDLSLATPVAALDADVNLSTVYAVMADNAATAAVADVLDTLATETASLAGTLSLQDLLEIDVGGGYLVNAELNVLDTAVALLQLYSYLYVASPPSAISLELDDLGLDTHFETVDLKLQVSEPPVLAVAEESTSFHSAALRLKLETDLVTLTLDDTAGLDTVLERYSAHST